MADTLKTTTRWLMTASGVDVRRVVDYVIFPEFGTTRRYFAQLPDRSLLLPRDLAGMELTVAAYLREQRQ